MPPVLPLVVFAAGIGGLGYWAHQDHLVDVENHVTQGATAVASAFTQHPIETTVSGRDIRVSGVAHTQAQRDEILDALNGVEGRRIVIDDLETLPVAEDYSFKATKSVEGMVIEGVMPSQASIDALTSALPDAQANLSLAAGEPNDAWADAVLSGVGALGTLEEGSVTFSGSDINVAGMASDSDTRDAATTAFSGIDGYTITQDIAVPTPSALNLTFDAERGAELSGSVMSAARGDELTALLPQRDLTVDLSANATAPFVDVDASVSEVSSTLDLFDVANLSVNSSGMTFDGVARAGEDAQALQSMLAAAMPEGAQITVTPATEMPDFGSMRQLYASDGAIQFNGIGWVPVIDGYSFSASKSADEINFSGVVPTAADRDALADYGDTSNVAVAGGWPNAEWTTAVSSGLESLQGLDAGTFTIVDQSAQLKGTALSSAQIETVGALAFPEGYTIERTIDVPESPQYSLQFDANSGAKLEGSFPSGTSLSDVTDALGLNVVDAAITDNATGDASAEIERLKSVGALIGEFETAELTVREDGIKFSGEALKGASTQVLAQRLQETLGADSDVNVTRTTRTYADGTTRLDPVTGELLTATNNYWIPLSQFQVSPETCVDATAKIQSAEQIDFITASSALDISARRVISRITGVLSRCLDGTAMRLVLGGHTDSVGEEDDNLRLSNDRADSVLNELANRGLDRNRMNAIGFGETAPVASNDTDEGRARNRRTEIEWVQN
jgi:OOP family OmpA-OmpF porin